MLQNTPYILLLNYSRQCRPELRTGQLLYYIWSWKWFGSVYRHKEGEQCLALMLFSSHLTEDRVCFN